jgi:hypothetical protein
MFIVVIVVLLLGAGFEPSAGIATGACERSRHASGSRARRIRRLGRVRAAAGSKPAHPDVLATGRVIVERDRATGVIGSLEFWQGDTRNGVHPSARLCPTVCPTSPEFPMSKPNGAGIIIRVSGVRVPPPALRQGPAVAGPLAF